jgi:hypothetical protein
MPSRAMLNAIDGLSDQQKASASQASPALAEQRAASAPAGRFQASPNTGDFT